MRGEPDMRVFLQNEIDKVFVYGTLKRTFARHNLLEQLEFIGQDSVRGYLFDIGAGFPVFVPEPTGPAVAGEIYRFNHVKNPNIIKALDHVECVPALYWRLPFRTGSNRVAWLYWMLYSAIRPEWKLIYTGNWLGKNSMTCEFNKFRDTNPQCQYPHKPKLKYDAFSRCMVVEQSEEGLQHAGDYTPFNPQAGMQVRNSDSSWAIPPERRLSTPKPAPEPAAKMVNLEWLGGVKPEDGKDQPEYDVEGI